MEEKIKEQLLAVRDTGETNMFDVGAVLRIANRMGFIELVAFIETHRRVYLNTIYTGRFPWEEGKNDGKD